MLYTKIVNNINSQQYIAVFTWSLYSLNAFGILKMNLYEW